MTQPADRPIDQNFLVRVDAAPARPIAAKDADVVIRVPAAATPPAPEIINQPGHGERIRYFTTIVQGVLNLLAQFGRDLLIRIDEKHPLARRLRMREGFLIAVARPTALDDTISILTRNLDRAIGAEGVDHHNLVAPRKASKTTIDVCFFIEADDDRGDRGFLSGHGTIQSVEINDFVRE